jgi:hypothetical protein
MLAPVPSEPHALLILFPLPAQERVVMSGKHANSGGYLPNDQYQGPMAQYDYYKQTYDAAGQSINSGSGLKGIMFWRWAGIDPNATVEGFDEAATISALPLLGHFSACMHCTASSSCGCSSQGTAAVASEWGRHVGFGK